MQNVNCALFRKRRHKRDVGVVQLTRLSLSAWSRSSVQSSLACPPLAPPSSCPAVRRAAGRPYLARSRWLSSCWPGSGVGGRRRWPPGAGDAPLARSSPGSSRCRPAASPRAGRSPSIPSLRKNRSISKSETGPLDSLPGFKAARAYLR